MSTVSAYKEALLNHYRHPRNRENPGDAEIVRRGRNPQCGDDLEIGVDFAGDHLDRVRFHGRGCSICIASASMMTEEITGKSRDEARALTDFMYQWFSDDDRGHDPIPETLLPLSPVRDMRARRRCALLAWEALNEVLAARTRG